MSTISHTLSGKILLSMVTQSQLCQQRRMDRDGYISQKEVREKYGQKYHIVMYEDRIELIPVADDPLAAIREAAGELHDASVEEIREDIEAEAKDEAEEAGGDR